MSPALLEAKAEHDVAARPYDPNVTDSWDRRIARAEQLAALDDSTRPLLEFYGKLLGLQREGYDRFETARLTGSVEQDLDVIRPWASSLLSVLPTIGPDTLGEETREVLDGGAQA